MGTKFASYSLKLASLHEYYQRVLHGSQMIPSGIEMANTLKYFIQCLLSLLKDIEKSPYDMLKTQKMDSERLALYPNLDYKQLYNALSQLIDIIPSINFGLSTFGRTLLQCLTCLLPFLEHELINSLPYLIASSIAVLPADLHQELMNYLCYHILPFTLRRKDDHEFESFGSQSISAVIMMIFEYSKETAYHCQLIETLMALKSGVVKDLLCTVAYGTILAKASAVKILFYYWPTFNKNLLDRKLIMMKFTSVYAPLSCQRENCPSGGNSEAAKVCYNHSVAIKFAAESPPPLYLCIECANEIHRDNPNRMFFDTLHPMHHDSSNCENKNCRSIDKSVISVCFSTECVNYNSNHPIRYCEQCHNSRHNNRRGSDHIYHKALEHISLMDSQMQTYMVQTIISLFKESELISSENYKERIDTSIPKMESSHLIGSSTESQVRNMESSNLEEKQLLGRFGVWLLIGLCTLEKEISPEILGRLLSMLFHWFHVTAYSYDGTKKSLVQLIFSVGQCESAMEKLKTDHVCGWLYEVKQKYSYVFLSCLLPHPSDNVRVGGHWETLATSTSHLKEGLSRLFCLVPYEIITSDIWDYVMPHWMEAIENEVPQSALNELKMTLNKILDPEMSPLGLEPKRMYLFIANRFINSNMQVQKQTLNWIQVLTRLEIIIPLPLLFSMFSNGITTLNQIEAIGTEDSNIREKLNSASSENERTLRPVCSIYNVPSSTANNELPSDLRLLINEELSLACCILMLDILLRQMELQNISKHTGVGSWVCRDVCNLLKSTNIASWILNHVCSSGIECLFCESTVIWHQLCLQLLTYIVPKQLAYPPDILSDELDEDFHRKSPLESSKKSDGKSDVMNMPTPELHSVGGVLVHMPHFFEQIMTATVETMSEQLDLATTLPLNKSSTSMLQIEKAVKNSDDLVINSIRRNSKDCSNEDLSESDSLDINIWETSQGKFKFNLCDLPEQLQYIFKLFKELNLTLNTDILCYELECLNKMCLYGDILNTAVKDHRDFFIWCQENVIIQNLWSLLQAENSHIAQAAVPLLLHSITLPCGQETFWSIIQKEFHCSNWFSRFSAVERVTLIARFIDSTPIQNAINLQASLAHVFCYLINSMDDSNTYVAQKATLYLGTIHDIALKAFLRCMETQFDLVVIDRPIILQSLYQLHNSLCDRKILTWEFFFNRFDTLFLEAQINLEKVGGTNFFRDLRSTDISKEIFQQKVNRANEALSHLNDSFINVKTLSSGFGAKWPYKRTISAVSPTPFVDFKDKEKIYSRQVSVPALKRKSSKFGLGQLIGYTLPNNSITDISISPLNASDDESFIALFNKIIEAEQRDHETVHLLVFLFHQFLSRSDQAYSLDEKISSQVQVLVLRHFYSLLGYNQIEKSFFIAPYKLRSSTVFDVFLANFSQVLDQNYDISSQIIESLLTILHYSPSPSFRTIVNTDFFPTFSIWDLEYYHRRSWLLSLLVILYKYEYKQQLWSSILLKLLKTVLFTLERQYHKCKCIPITAIMSAGVLRSRDVSQPSLTIENDSFQTKLVKTESQAIESKEFTQKRSYSFTQPSIDEFIGSDKTINQVTYQITSISNDHLLSSKDSFGRTTSKAVSSEKDVLKKNKETCMLEIEKNSEHISTNFGENIDSIQKSQLVSVAPDNSLSINFPKVERLLPVGVIGRINDQLKDINIEVTNIQTSLEDITELELPLPERLLPIGYLKEYTKKSLGFIEQRTLEVPASTSKSFKENWRDEIESGQINLTAMSKVFSETDESTRLKEISRKSLRKLKKQMATESLSYCFDYRSEFSYFPDQVLKNDENLEKKEDCYFATHFHSNLSTTRRLDKKGCSECGIPLEEYTDEEIGLCMTILGALIHREPALAAPMLPEILNTITHISLNLSYSWQSHLSIHLPGGTVSVAHQFLRCVLHQMAPNGIFTQIFQTKIKGLWCKKYFKSISQALLDFNELNPIAPLQILLENLNAKKFLQAEYLIIILYNIASYLESLPLDTGLSSGLITWNVIVTQFECLFRRLVIFLPFINDFKPIYKIMVFILKIPGIQISKALLDPFSKFLSHCLQNSVICYTALEELCSVCSRVFTKDRDKYYLSRTVTFELMQALKFKTILPDVNLLLIIQFLLRDVGGFLLIALDSKISNTNVSLHSSTNLSESLKSQVGDIIDFLMDTHSSNKLKSFKCGLRKGFNEDTLCGNLKCGLAQYVALEITKNNGRENRAVNRYIPWLYTTTTATQSSREYFDCISRIRLLSWLLLGSLNFFLVNTKNKSICFFGNSSVRAQPIPPEASCHIAEYIQSIFSMFPDQYRTSTINLSSLFHSFNLCQLWTLYLESNINQSNTSNENHNPNILIEFWSKITPSVLQLLSHSKVIADIVSLHFLYLLETFLDCQSLILDKLLPIWNPILLSTNLQLPEYIRTRLRYRYNDGSTVEKISHYMNDQGSKPFMYQWLRRLQFRMGQIEMQSSNTIQFYSL